MNGIWFDNNFKYLRLLRFARRTQLDREKARERCDERVFAYYTWRIVKRLERFNEWRRNDKKKIEQINEPVLRGKRT